MYWLLFTLALNQSAFEAESYPIHLRYWLLADAITGLLCDLQYSLVGTVGHTCTVLGEMEEVQLRFFVLFSHKYVVQVCKERTCLPNPLITITLQHARVKFSLVFQVGSCG